MNADFSLDELQDRIENILINNDQSYLGCRIQQVFKDGELTFFIYWFDENDFVKNVGFSFPYSDILQSNINLADRICDLLDKELKLKNEVRNELE